MAVLNKKKKKRLWIRQIFQKHLFYMKSLAKFLLKTPTELNLEKYTELSLSYVEKCKWVINCRHFVHLGLKKKYKK